ncbi:hypothetical protein RI054_31g124560 [Pseudoscourfieldia marina]
MKYAPAALEKPLLVSTSAMASPSHALCKPMLKATRTPCCHPLSALNATPMEIPSPLCMHRQTSKYSKHCTCLALLSSSLCPVVVVAADEKIPKCSRHALYHARDIEEITIETPKSST